MEYDLMISFAELTISKLHMVLKKIKRNTNSDVISTTALTAPAKDVIEKCSWYVEKSTTILENQHLVADQMLPDVQTELCYEERAIFLNEKHLLVVFGFSNWERKIGK